VTDAQQSRLRGSLLKWFLVAALLALGFWAYRHLQFQQILSSLLDRVAGFGFWAPLVFVSVYVVATVFLIPGSVLTLGAGAVFGLGWGLVWVTLGANLGAQSAFLVGRYLARDWVARKIESRPAFRAIDQAVADEGWKIVLLTRLSPVFPFTFLNYALGLTRVRFRHYAPATFFGMMPGTVLYVYLGALARAGVQGGGRTPGQWVLLVVGLLATLVVTVFIARLSLRALNRKVEPNP
jgi:uncharacterized membrane protein YdjX (TVP38/TMEM64 family)